MNENEFLKSAEFDTLFKELINLKSPSMARIQKKKNLSFQQAKTLYEEYLRYNDEVFMHNALYELSFEDEPPTIARIMNKFDVSYYLAEKIFDYYMENC